MEIILNYQKIPRLLVTWMLLMKLQLESYQKKMQAMILTNHRKLFFQLNKKLKKT
jgi:hypothetical protein